VSTIDPHTKPLDDFFRALMRLHDFCTKQEAAEADLAANRARRSPTTMNDKTHNAKIDNVEIGNAETENATIENALTVVNLNPPAVITDGWERSSNRHGRPSHEGHGKRQLR
jgi:hypothetical protein